MRYLRMAFMLAVGGLMARDWGIAMHVPGLMRDWIGIGMAALGGVIAWHWPDHPSSP